MFRSKHSITCDTMSYTQHNEGEAGQHQRATELLMEILSEIIELVNAENEEAFGSIRFECRTSGNPVVICFYGLSHV